MTTWPEATVMRLLAATGIFLVGVVYVRGWRQMARERRRLRRPPVGPVSTRPLWQFMAGLALLAVALISPLGYLATQYFSARIVQHMLVVASIPSLIMLSNPVVPLAYGLPARQRDALLVALRRPAAASSGHLRRAVHWATSPGVTLLTFLCVCWFWYDPTAHAATLRYSWVHAIELLSLFGAGLLNWWHITAAWPRTHGTMHPMVRIVYAFVSIWPVKLVGLALLFFPEINYGYPATFQFSGLHINDYNFGAMIAWIVSGLAYAVAAVALARQWLGEEADKPALPESAWATDESMNVPGLKR